MCDHCELKRRSHLAIDDEGSITGVKEMDVAVEIIKHDETFQADTGEVKFYQNARVRELYEDKGTVKHRPVKIFSASGSMAPDLNVAFVRMGLGFKISFPPDSKPLLSMTLTTSFFVLSKTEAAKSAEDMELERALQAAGHRTGAQMGGAAAASSFEQPRKRLKLSLGKKKN